jgi:ABC-type polysaccharide/polyol phosphate transport system ATPase subunit
MFTKVTGLFKKYPARLPDFPKNVHQSYQTFQKTSGKVIGIFGKNEGQKNTFSHLILQRTLPDFLKKTR